MKNTELKALARMGLKPNGEGKITVTNSIGTVYEVLGILDGELRRIDDNDHWILRYYDKTVGGEYTYITVPDLEWCKEYSPVKYRIEVKEEDVDKALAALRGEGIRYRYYETLGKEEVGQAIFNPDK